MALSGLSLLSKLHAAGIADVLTLCLCGAECHALRFVWSRVARSAFQHLAAKLQPHVVQLRDCKQTVARWCADGAPLRLGDWQILSPHIRPQWLPTSMYQICTPPSVHRAVQNLSF